MTTQRCCHGELLARWCDDCATDFLLRTDGPGHAVTWTPARKERRMPVELIVLTAAVVAVIAVLLWNDRRAPR